MHIFYRNVLKHCVYEQTALRFMFIECITTAFIKSQEGYFMYKAAKMIKENNLIGEL